MEWTRYAIRTVTSAEEAVSAVLIGLGIDSFETEDHLIPPPSESGGLFGDVVPDFSDEGDEAVISFYLDPEEEHEELLTLLRERLGELRAFTDIGEGSITESVSREEDWINRWKEHFHRFYVDDILIVPGWEEDKAEDEEAALTLHIDPGTAFGTGAHESTRLAIRAIRKYIRKGDRVLDIGTGSGILGIVALKSGADFVFGTDLDDNTLPAIEENLAKNAVPDSSFQRILGNIADDPSVQKAAGFESYDLACANIIAEILTEITPAVPAHLKKGGVYITSGILQEKEGLVLSAAEQAGFRHLETLHEGEWSSIVFRRD